MLCKTNLLTPANPPLPSPPQKENIFSDLNSFEKRKKKTLALATPPHPSVPTAIICFVRFGFFIKKNHFPDSLYKKISVILAATPPPPHSYPPTEENNSLMHHTLDTCSLSMTYYLEVTVTYISWPRDCSEPL